MSKKNPFPYPGGKALTAPRILDKFPEHDCYVEVFGGAASVLCQKDARMSTVEVYNDLNDDVVNYFEVARRRPGELREYLDSIPYARSTHAEMKERWFGRSERPDDDVIRAAEFLYLRCSNQNGLFGKSGFSSSPKRNQATRFRGVADRIEWVADRFRDVVIENDDWERIVDRYDGPGTLFYMDPPYVHLDRASMYGGSDPTSFDHERFAECLHDVEGHWIVSYSEVPGDLDRYVVVDWMKNWNSGRSDEEQEEVYGKESLVMNFDPDDVVGQRMVGDPHEW